MTCRHLSVETMFLSHDVPDFLRKRVYLLQGTPYCYRFRVPSDQEILIPDRIRGDVRFNTNALGDFVILRSNGLPVYNFCVAVDDALMRITHVIRAVRISSQHALACFGNVLRSCNWSSKSSAVRKFDQQHATCFFDSWTHLVSVCRRSICQTPSDRWDSQLQFHSLGF